MPSVRLDHTLRWLLPKNGMTWHPGSAVTHRNRVDASVVRALLSLGVALSKRDVQVALTQVVDAATDLARQTPSDVERSEFALALRNQLPLGLALPPAHFEQMFVAIVLARQQYLDDRQEAGLPVEDPAAHSHMARAVDAFEAAAAGQVAVGGVVAGGGVGGVGGVGVGGGVFGGGFGVGGFGGVGGEVGGGQATAFPNDPAYVSLAAGVSAMEIDDVRVAGDAGGAEVGTGAGEGAGAGGGGWESGGGDAMDIDG
ncbi:hypothetical protein B0J18DRAFT_462099 [Chaetomium sp. MPI-SDFR-AT-0129]|nr:hypothetical protein B0J18DRAFT_462099 [Chaetomium sp. MPI-SDFR-AT-0129]